MKLKPYILNIVFLSSLIFLNILSAPITSHAQDNPKEKVTIKLRWRHQFQFAGYYAAKEKGYYNDAGLDVIIEEYNPGDKNSIQCVLDGDANYGITHSEILYHRLQGKPLVVLGSIFQHSPLVFVSRKETGITNPQAMMGHRVKMIIDSRDMELLSTLKNEGVPIEKLDLINSHVNKEDYFDKSIDVLSAYLTNEPYYLEKNGIEFTLIKPLTYGIDFYGDCLFTSENEIKKHPKRVKAFREASLKGWEYAMDNPEEIIDIILEKYGSQKERDHLLYEALKMQELILPELIQIGHTNLGRWHHIADTFIQTGLIDKGYSLDGFIYNPNPTNNYSGLLWLFRISLIIILFIAIIAVSLMIFNRRLRKEITERKMAEQALKESEYNLLQAERIAHLGSWYMNLATNEFVTSEELDKIFKLPNKNIEFDDWREYVLKKDWQNVDEAFQKAIVEGKPYSLDIEIKRSDGKIRTLSTQGEIIQDKAGKAIKLIGTVLDITKKKKIETELQESEERFRTLFNEIPIGLAMGGTSGVSEENNPALQKMLGYSEDELKQISIQNFSHPDDSKKDLELLEEIIKGTKDRYTMEKRYIRKDGTMFWGQLTVSAARNADGKIQFIIGMVQDIDGRKKAEQALRESENRYRGIFEGSIDGIVFIDSDGSFIDCNQSYLDMLGYSKDELMLLTFYEITPKRWHEWERVEIIEKELLKKGYTETYEKEYIRKDGSIFPVEITGYKLKGELGRPTLLWGVTRDISERKKAEEALKRERDIVRRIMETSPIAITQIDTKGNIVFANHMAETIFGLTKNEITQRIYDAPEWYITDFQGNPFPHENLPFIKVLTTQKPVYNIQHAIQWANGKRILLSINAAPFFNHLNELEGIVASVEDITQRIKGEQKLRETLHEKEVLLKEVHHRVKNNLQTVSTLLYLHSLEVSDGNLLEILRESQNRIKSMSMIHEQMYQSDDLGQIDISSYIHNLTSELFHSYSLDPSIIQLQVDVNNILLGIDTAIPCGLIINELISNSFKHAFPKGQAGNVFIKFFAEDDNYHLLISDDGVAFPKNFDITQTQTMGLELVTDLISYQLDGKFTLNFNERKTFEIIFPIPKYERGTD